MTHKNACTFYLFWLKLHNFLVCNNLVVSIKVISMIMMAYVISRTTCALILIFFAKLFSVVFTIDKGQQINFFPFYMTWESLIFLHGNSTGWKGNKKLAIDLIDSWLILMRIGHSTVNTTLSSSLASFYSKNCKQKMDTTNHYQLIVRLTFKT